MTYNALRRGRFSGAGQVYFVTTVSKDRQPLFEEFALARMVVSHMRQLQDETVLESLAWVVMPDHLHWLFALKPGHGLAEVMKKLKGRSSTPYRNMSGVREALWQPNYQDHALRNEEDLQELARYIVANPLRKGIVRSIGDYPHWDAVWL